MLLNLDRSSDVEIRRHGDAVRGDAGIKRL